MANKKTKQENNIKLTPDQEKQIEKIKKEMETFQKKVLEKFDKYVIGITLLPINKEKPEDINILVLVDDSDSKKMGKEDLKTKLSSIIQEMGKEVDKNIIANTLIVSELLESCYDGKSEYLEIISKSAITFDKGMLAAVKIGEIHKRMIISKFEKYIVTYALFGSLTRGEANEKSDIDVAIIIDDTDVKKMTRAELKDKLRAIIIGMGYEAGEMTGIKNKLNIQVYILTDFWESVRDANPVIFTVLRDGVPFYDRGIFMPWKQLLKMGKIKPSQESIDMFINTGDEIIKRIRGKIKNLVESDIYWATLTPSQAALMIYGVPPPTPKETIKLMEDLFVKKENLLEKEYVDILKNNRKYYKDIEHGIVKEISGKEVDKLLNDSEKYLKRIKKLFDELYILREKETLTQIKDNVISVTREILKTQNINETSEKEIINNFEKNIINKGIVPQKFLTFLKNISKDIKIFENTNSPARSLARLKMKAFLKDGFTILILGERGVGKSQLVKDLNKNKSKDIERVNCASFADDTMAESALFGYTKGAFTGASKDTDGHFQNANGKILFLDEVHHLSKRVQAKLMLALETDSNNFFNVRKLGSSKEDEIKCTIILASNKKIEEIKDILMPDFYDRIAQLIIEIPPLRETSEDRVEDWKTIWEQMKFGNKETAPSDKNLMNWIIKQPLYGNFRDLQLIAMYYKSYMDFDNETKEQTRFNTAVDYAIAEFEKYHSNEEPMEIFNFSEDKTIQQMEEEYHKEFVEWALKRKNNNLKEVERHFKANGSKIDYRTLSKWKNGK